jgi:TolB-like protein
MAGWLFLACLMLANSSLAANQDKFYNYYDNGLAFLEKGDCLRAVEEFKSAISLEFEDAKQKRTYGTRFIKYFPHRELGIAYFELGEYSDAQSELELSLAYEKSKRAEEYLQKIKSGNLKEPDVAVQTPAEIEEPPVEEPEETPPPPPEPKVTEEPKAKEPDVTTEVIDKPKPLPPGAMTYEPSRVTQVGSRLSIAVMRLDAKGEAEEYQDLLSEKMVTQLVNLRRFRVIERSALDKILQEQALGVSGVVDEATAVQIGKVAGADAIVFGSINVSDRYGKVTARVISVETSETIVAEEADTDRPNIKNMEKITEQVAVGIYNAMPLVEGNIIGVEAEDIYIDIGGNVGLRKGTKCIAFSAGDPIVHPVTGEVIGQKNKKLAELVVSQVQDRMAIARFVEGGEGDVKTGDKVVVK